MMFEESKPNSHYVIPHTTNTLRVWELTYSSHFQRCFCHVRYHCHHRLYHRHTVHCVNPSSFYFCCHSLFLFSFCSSFCFLMLCVVFSIYFIRYYYLNMFADFITSRARPVFRWSFFLYAHDIYYLYVYVWRIWFVPLNQQNTFESNKYLRITL